LKSSGKKLFNVRNPLSWLSVYIKRFDFQLIPMQPMENPLSLVVRKNGYDNHKQRKFILFKWHSSPFEKANDEAKKKTAMQVLHGSLLL